jgi:hypothetical protein
MCCVYVGWGIDIQYNNIKLPDVIGLRIVLATVGHAMSSSISNRV